MRFVHWSLGLAVLAALLLLYLEPPGGQGFYPGCGLYADHGLHCPGCGGLRATHALLHGDVLTAVRMNALYVLGIPVALGWWVLCRRRVVSAPGPRAIWVLFAIAVAFTVARNLPYAPFQALAPQPL